MLSLTDECIDMRGWDMDERIARVIAKAVADAERYPFLFIGSGLSRRYAGSPDWSGLLEGLCDSVLHDAYAFARYNARAHTAVINGVAISELPYAATLMENDVNDKLLSASEFASFREKHGEVLRTGQSPMKTYVADYVSDFKPIANAETKLLARAGKEKVSGVITTNYDSLCEKLFPSFKVYTDESDLLFSEPSFVQEIYKIHGSIDCPDGLVLTEGDYRKFAEKRKYLAAKLLTIFAEYPVVFLGYSIKDENIKSILSDICVCVPKSQLDRLHDRMVFVEHGQHTYVNDHTMDLNGHLLSMTRITTDDFMSVYEGILQTKRLYSPRVIRELKGNVFRLAERIDPTSEVVTSGFDALLDQLGPNQKVAIQIAMSSASIGKPISAEDIFQDILLDDLRMDHRFIVDNYLNTLARRLAGAIPFYKYIADIGDDVGKAIEEYRKEYSTLDSFRTGSDRKDMGKTHSRFDGVSSVRELADICAPKPPFRFIPHLYHDEIDVDELGELLKSSLAATTEGSSERRDLLKDSPFRKCIRIYDYLRFGR